MRKLNGVFWLGLFFLGVGIYFVILSKEVLLRIIASWLIVALALFLMVLDRLPEAEEKMKEEKKDE